MCSSTTAERQSLASRDRTCCLRRCLPARPLRFSGFRGSIAHPTRLLCTLRTRRRRRPRNTRYRAPATAYPDRSLTGRITPALPGAQAIQSFFLAPGLLRRFAPRNDEGGDTAEPRPPQTNDSTPSNTATTMAAPTLAILTNLRTDRS